MAHTPMLQPPQTSENGPTAQLRTSAGAQIPLQAVRFDGSLVGGKARIAVHQRYQNTESIPLEAVYIFPLPSDATLYTFSMKSGGRTLTGVVQEREQAFRTYDNALVAGHGAALVEQERPNVFTANVGNILPGEEVELVLEYLQTLRAEEGFISWRIPTMVAPRYIPGTPTGSPTSDGWSPPTDRVPDADRITPPVGGATYTLELALRLDLGRPLQVESPSHALDLQPGEGHEVLVRLAQKTTALDRDLVLNLRSEGEGSFTTLSAHKDAGEAGFFALTVVPDLMTSQPDATGQTLVFLVDVSGSMSGQSIEQARAALQLCLRNLREGDRFNLIAFSSSFRSLHPAPVPFTQASLHHADAWVQALVASGGTELLEPLVTGATQAGNGLLVVLTDGEVGNEAEILRAFLGLTTRPRVYSFGIGTNVSDALLKDLSRHSSGALEMIYPGERIEDKVLAQLSRAIAPRVRGVSLKLEGLELMELTPQTMPDLVDGEPVTLYGRYQAGGTGRAILRGTLYDRPFGLEVQVALPESASEPALKTLWAGEKIRDLQALQVSGRRESSNRARIIELATTYSVSTPFTSFVVVEQRTGARNQPGIPERRTVPTHIPAGWAMFDAAPEAQAQEEQKRSRARMSPPVMARMAIASPSGGAAWSASAPPPPPVVMPSPMAMPRPAAPPAAAPMKMKEAFHEITGEQFAPALEALVFDRSSQDELEEVADFLSAPPPPPAPVAASAPRSESLLAQMKGFLGLGGRASEQEKGGGGPGASSGAFAAAAPLKREAAEAPDTTLYMGLKKVVAAPRRAEPITHETEKADTSADPVGLLKLQLASGHFPAGGSTEPEALLRATTAALVQLHGAGITASHPLYGGQLKKAVDAVLGMVGTDAASSVSRDLLMAALGAAWLVSTGRRTRTQLEKLADSNGTPLGDEAAVKARVTAFVQTGG